MIAISAGGARAAVCRVMKPPQETPRMPTDPLHQSCVANQAITAAASVCSCGRYSSSSRPSESPDPRASSRAKAMPHCASLRPHQRPYARVLSRLR